MDGYMTVLHEGIDEFTEKRSRFIGHMLPVTTERAALDFIASVKSKRWDAKHNVYAYIVRENNICRFSDDGEPKGTAGVPVLEVLQKSGVTDCAVVVTRYFGGILLGAGGLVRAYSHAAKLALDAAGIAVMRRCLICSFQCDYSSYGRAQTLLAAENCQVRDVQFEADVKVTFMLPEQQVADFDAKLTEAFFGRVVLKKLGEEFAPFATDE